jgi:NhaA family Na+:H+ antiporter
MTDGRPTESNLTRLPKELADRMTKPFARFLRVEAAAGAVLLASVWSAVAGLALLVWVPARGDDPATVEG